jgi:BirA family biotin operon repressor/biotin-[acetyl-CoA-carboxylase] ligase
MQNKILDFLKKKSGYISGEEISNHLKISRQALWKHIQELRDAGYDIVAVPHLGYRMISAPDRLYPCEIACGLNTRFIGKKISYFDTVSSTMDVAIQLGIQGAGEGTLILAEAQTRGRGRLARGWFSPKHKGIYASLILRPQILPNSAPILTLLAAVSICEAIKEVAGLDTRIKWPNDILIHNKKLGGILTELNAEMDITRFIVIGIGLNVNNDKKQLIEGATSLKAEKKEDINPAFPSGPSYISRKGGVNRISLLQEILRRIEINYLLFQERDTRVIINKWRDYGITLGKRVKVICQKKHLEGEAVDIDSDGGLLIRKDSGLIEKVMAGDVVHCK